jgi:hypothetical protein
MYRNQKGFSSIEIIIVFIVLGFVGLAGWYVWHKNQVHEAPKTNSSEEDHKQQKSNPDKQAVKTIPEGYVAYENIELGFKVAYPNEWGQVKDISSMPGNGDKKYFTIGIWKNNELTAKINSYPKESCPGGDDVATSASQGWYEKNGAYYVMWCKNSPEANGNEHLVDFGNSEIKRLDDKALMSYIANFANDPASHMSAVVGLLNLADNNDYAGISISRLWNKNAQLNDKELLQEFEKVLTTFEEL